MSDDAKKHYPIGTMEAISEAIIAQGRALSPRVDLGGGYYYYKVSAWNGGPRQAGGVYLEPRDETSAIAPPDFDAAITAQESRIRTAVLGHDPKPEERARVALRTAEADRAGVYAVQWPCPAPPGEIDWAWIVTTERHIYGSPREHNRDYEHELAACPAADARVATAGARLDWRDPILIVSLLAIIYVLLIRG